jgi:tetratricopeptide (TPR) repeat protein
MQMFKLFVSSPGDVMVERRRVENVASRLNGEFAGVARLEVIRWETKNYQAFSTFQAQIPRSVDCDLVIGILKWRLGTELPPDFSEKLPDGHSFPSGTAYEILTAIENRQKGLELPDVYVFRFAGSSPAVAIEDPDRDKIEHDWQALKAFFQGWFLTAQGHFKAAFNPYISEDDLEAQLEQLLRSWLAEKVAGGQAVRWPIAVKGSPFCGLAAFGARHAPVFFGRSHDTTRAVDLWRDAGQRNSPYLLVIGASGSGKSSLARAGLVPRLTTPGVIREVDVWRVAVMRPSDSPQGPFAALAAALMQSEAGLSKEEEGRGAALPEIALGDSRTPADLASVLSHANPAAAIKPIVNALTHVAATEHDRGNYTRDVRCDLTLLIDQLDELFAATVSDAERDGFLDLVAAMVATGRIWVVTTLRADLYPRMLGQSALKRLKELGATYDLAPPGPVELAEIVRSPAEAAGLVYEMDAAGGERLDARLLRDAEQPDMLPLVQLALSRLFEGRQQVDGELRLPLAVYQNLGGLKGIIDEAGERAIASVGEAEQARLPRLLRRLAVPARDQSLTVSDALTVRAAPLVEAAPDAASQRLLDALVTARLLTVSGNEADASKEKDTSIAPVAAQVRLTHQRVLQDWSRARTIVAESADFYRVRSDLEENYRRWNNGDRRGELLLARGLPLAEAENIVGKYGDELTPDVRDYVKASRKRANRAQMIGWSAAAVFALVALGAGFEWKTASEQRAAAEAARHEAQIERDRAEGALALATGTANGLVFDLAKKFRDVIGVPAATIKDILDRARQLQDQLLGSGEVDPELRRSRAIALLETANTFSTLGDTQSALATATQAQEIFQSLLVQQPNSIDVQRGISATYDTMGFVQTAQGHLHEALTSYQSGLAISDRLAKSGNADWLQRDRAVSYKRIGDVQIAQGHLPEALAAYQSGLAIADRLAKSDLGNTRWQRQLSDSFDNIGDVQVAQGHLLEALTSYQSSLAIVDRLVKADPGNTSWQHDQSVSYERIGDVQRVQGHLPEALTTYHSGLAILDRLVKADPGNTTWQHNLAGIYERVGLVQVAQGHLPEALTSYQADFVISDRLAKSDPGNASWQRSQELSYGKIGDVQMAQGHLPEALTSYQAALAIAGQLAKSDSSNAEWQRDLTVCYYKVGDAQSEQGHLPEALTSYQAGFAIFDRLAKSDPSNAGWQHDLGLSYEKIGDMQVAQGHLPEAMASYQAALAVGERLVKSDPDNTDWQRGLSVSYQNVGLVQAKLRYMSEALTSFQSSFAIRERLAKSDPGNAGWQHDLSMSYGYIGGAQEALGHLPEALTSYQARYAVADRLITLNPDNADWRSDVQYVNDSLGGLSYNLLLRSEFAKALEAVDLAISHAPDKIWLYANRAHALMFLDRTQEARALYLQYREEKNVQDGKSWTAAILEDFAELRKAGLSRPLMDEIETQFAGIAASRKP